ncbi:Wzz/FepE/Etk N-terminal domain-containing protein [Chromohalobacter israelensis]|uniref:Lipopolysaccharide biosynthesis n=1 Tax=Chromohalobacter israelensis (strain ATCC BAA-138 / DSM 3043 / CIP 106854 / NCIMB 13768 / 1H11) TaxID=290398 RepID=Q1QWX3_CHRI1|nr:Wzz/FepE/Etk N-terminal domain-containing protein [Chromohalobacter salexigens]ABE59035.1 lipopolysaccharide biosynthesis [Chromohalobacter salexigens DSM 3043]
MTQPPASQSPTPERRYEHDDEISLVDLAVILIRRWKAMAVIFFVVVAIAAAAAFLLPQSYQYTSLYSVAEYTNDNGQRVGVESPASVVAKTQNLYLGQATRKLLEKHELESLPFNVSVSNPSNTLLLQLDSDAAEENQPLASELHQQIIDRLQQDQAQLVERRHDSLERQLASAKQALESAQQSDSPSAAELIATYYSRISDIEGQLNELREGEVTQHAVQSLEPTGVSRKLILIAGVILGGILAITGAFVMQFSGSVCRSLKES